jgi:hypothetical protein
MMLIFILNEMNILVDIFTFKYINMLLHVDMYIEIDIYNYFIMIQSKI